LSARTAPLVAQVRLRLRGVLRALRGEIKAAAGRLLFEHPFRGSGDRQLPLDGPDRLFRLRGGERRQHQHQRE